MKSRLLGSSSGDQVQDASSRVVPSNNQSKELGSSWWGERGKEDGEEEEGNEEARGKSGGGGSLGLNLSLQATFDSPRISFGRSGLLNFNVGPSTTGGCSCWCARMRQWR
eukprot:65398-Hanusia_phi.AAC.3